MRTSRRLGLALLVTALAGLCPARAQVSGTVFEDRDGDGLRDPGEPGLAGVDVELFGTRDAGGAFDQTVATTSTGSFSIAPGAGCYLLGPRDPAGWRASAARSDDVAEGTPGYTFPIGRSRFAKLDHGVGHLKAGALRYTAMGDSIAVNFNLCFAPEDFWYSRRFRDRLACTAPAAAVTLDEAAISGEHTDDLLVDDADHNNVFRVIEQRPELVTISMIGNDMLNVDPPAGAGQADINRAVEELLDSRQNLQEALSALVSEIPDADVALNSLYDNLAYNCYTGTSSDFHRRWFPIMNRILRDLAWGQTRRLSINEAAAEFSHEDQLAACFGFDAMICRDFFGLDEIHPNNNGYTLLREKVWEAAGGVNLGPKDALSRTAIGGADYGYLRHVARLRPTRWEARDGAVVTSPEAALDDADGGAEALVQLGTGTEEFRLAGFPDWLDELQIVRVLASVRYRTTGTVGDDLYRIEASVGGQFRPPAGHAYTPTDWNYATPIVGGGGPNRPASNPDYPDAHVLVRPSVATPRHVSATLTKNPTLATGAGDYAWPAVTHADLATTAVRVAAAPVAGTPGDDDYRVALDAAWLDVYGWERPRPVEAGNLRVSRLADGSLELVFDEVPGAQRYNVYFGRLATVRAGSHDHGRGAPAGPLCAAATSEVAPGRLRVVVPPAQQPSDASDVLVTAHLDDVESPSGRDSEGVEIDRSQSTCR